MNNAYFEEHGIKWFTDPGHGWLRVPKGELKGFKPSVCSFQDQAHVYLEEDSDAPGWLDHRGIPRDLARGLPETSEPRAESFVRRLRHT